MRYGLALARERRFARLPWRVGYWAVKVSLSVVTLVVMALAVYLVVGLILEALFGSL
jgi:hypothetical protein